MAHVVILTANKDGKVELTRDELQKMLDDAYNKGYTDGNDSSITITYPSHPYYIPNWYYTTTDKVIDKDKVEITC